MKFKVVSTPSSTHGKGKLQLPEGVSPSRRFGIRHLKLSDDWKGADFIAKHVSGRTCCSVKSRLTIDKKYSKTNPYICFPSKLRVWYLCRHNDLVKLVFRNTNVRRTYPGETRVGIRRRIPGARYYPPWKNTESAQIA